VQTIASSALPHRNILSEHDLSLVRRYFVKRESLFGNVDGSDVRLAEFITSPSAADMEIGVNMGDENLSCEGCDDGMSDVTGLRKYEGRSEGSVMLMIGVLEAYVVKPLDALHVGNKVLKLG
jgi:hypothetical protein